MEDIEIARNAEQKNIKEITDKLHIPEEYVFQYGKNKAKVDVNYINSLENEDGKLILVTSINPTPLGEGKTTTSIGLCDALNKIGKKSVLSLREPSLGPVFGIKGGATGGGYSQVMPMEEINLHFTGDMHAITAANNLLSSVIDNHIYNGNELGIEKVVWKRCLDVNDRALRRVEIGLGGAKGITPREEIFDITAASEIMAILCLSKDLQDLKRRISNIIVGYNKDGKEVTCKDLKVEGALTVLLKDAINPNVVQTLENNPAIIHGGPFANIAHGCSSIIATKLALKTSEYAVTEAGFGADLGAEKFLNIKTRILGKTPDCVVIVATLRALKYHGGVSKDEAANKNVDALKAGINNLKKHIENIKGFGLKTVVAINRFKEDTSEEIEILSNEIKELSKIELIENYAKGSEGAVNLAEEVVRLCEENKEDSENNGINYTYDLEDNIVTKIEKVATKIYGAEGVDISEIALDQINRIENQNLPVCISKTQYSFSDDAKNLLCDTPHRLHITSVEYKAGAEFVVARTGKILTMPGLPKVPAAENIDIDENGEIKGIF